MSLSKNQTELNSDPLLSNTAVNRGMAGSSTYRDPIPSTSTANPLPNPSLPPLPPRIDNMSLQPSYGMNGGYGYGGMGGMAGSYGMGGMGGYGMGAMGGYGMGSGYMGGGYGMSGMGGMYGGYNRFGAGGPMYGDIESRFIQMAEESSRPAFDSIQSVVYAVGSVAMMLENTFFALSSSFRAILGVAENFGRLRSLFAQFWSTFTVIRTINWLIRKLLVILGIRTESEFKAWAQAVAATQAPGSQGHCEGQPPAGWPILLFLGVITAAPYIVLRMMRGLTTSLSERLNDPKTWQEPLKAVAQYDFQATSPQEISFSANQVIQLASQSLQGNLWNSGWLMGSTDRQTAGLVPVNYIKVIRPAVPPTSSDEKPQEPNVNLEQYYDEQL